MHCDTVISFHSLNIVYLFFIIIFTFSFYLQETNLHWFEDAGVVFGQLRVKYVSYLWMHLMLQLKMTTIDIFLSFNGKISSSNILFFIYCR